MRKFRAIDKDLTHTMVLAIYVHASPCSDELRMHSVNIPYQSAGVTQSRQHHYVAKIKTYHFTWIHFLLSFFVVQQCTVRISTRDDYINKGDSKTTPNIEFIFLWLRPQCHLIFFITSR